MARATLFHAYILSMARPLFVWIGCDFPHSGQRNTVTLHASQTCGFRPSRSYPQFSQVLMDIAGLGGASARPSRCERIGRGRTRAISQPPMNREMSIITTADATLATTQIPTSAYCKATGPSQRAKIPSSQPTLPFKTRATVTPTSAPAEYVATVAAPARVMRIGKRARLSATPPSALIATCSAYTAGRGSAIAYRGQRGSFPASGVLHQ